MIAPHNQIVEELCKKSPLYGTAPDAYGDLLVDKRPRTSSESSLLRRQQIRRAGIYRQARILIGEEGCRAFSVRNLARVCDLSPQTIYNLVGEREQIIYNAVDRHQSAMVNAIPGLSNPRHPQFFIELTEVMWCCAIKNPQFVNKVSQAYFSNFGNLNEIVRSRVNETLSRELGVLEDARKLRKSVDIHALADQMIALSAAATRDWELSGGAVPLRKRLVSAFGYLLLGAMRHEEFVGVESWMESVSSDH